MSLVLCVGHAVQDFIFRVPELPQRAEKYRASSFSSVGGGPAATAAVSVVRLGGTARLVARVGDDAIAATIRHELEDYGVDCRHVRTMPGRQSSLSAVCVDDRGERMIVNHSDPLMPVDPAWLEEISLEGVKAVLADTRWPEGAQRMLGRARTAGIPGVLDADVPVPRLQAFIESASHVAFSLAGLRDYAGSGCEDLDDVLTTLQRVARECARWCCVTLGADGVACSNGMKPEVIPGFVVSAVDTLGAGDVWHGAFALSLAEGANERESVRAASAAAAVKVTRTGGRAGVPTRAERDRILQGSTP